MPTPKAPVDRILEVAATLFYAHGIQAVGINQIISEAGVAKASFYDHFPSKDDLVIAFLERRDAAWRTAMDAAVQRLSPDPAGRPLALFDALAERFAKRDFRGCAFINTMVEMADPDHRAHRTAAAHKQAVIALISRLLAEAGHPGSEPLAADLMLLIDGAIVTAVREGRPEAAATAKRIAATLIASSR